AVVEKPSVRFAATAVDEADGMFSVVSVVRPVGLLELANSALFGNGIAAPPHSDGFAATGSNSDRAPTLLPVPSSAFSHPAKTTKAMTVIQRCIGAPAIGEPTENCPDRAEWH